MHIDREASKVVVARAVRRMSPDLKRQYDAARRLLATSTSADVRARHRVGAIVAEIKVSEDRYGARAVTLLSQALGKDETTLYRYAMVAETWNEEEIAEILLRRTPTGEPVSWSHLLELAAVTSASDRARYLNQAISHGLSVRQLAQLARRGTLLPGHHARTLTVPLSRLRRLVDACGSIERRFVLDDAFVDSLDTSTGDAEKILTEARAAQARIVRLLEQNLATLERAEAKLRAPALPSGPVLPSRPALTEAPRARSVSAPRTSPRGFPRLLVGMAS
jgi:hypothetical protein